MESNKSKENIIKLIITIAVLVFVIGASFAFFSTSSTTTQQDITVGNIGITFDDETEWLNNNNIIPIAENEVFSNAAKKTFSITNTGNINEYVDINLTSLTVSSNLRAYDMKWALYEGNTKITTGNFLNGNSDINMINNILLTPSLEKTYDLYVWLNENGENQYYMSQPAEGEVSKPTISLKIVANALHKSKNTLESKYDFNSAKTNPSFTSNSTDSGLYVEKGDSSKSEFGFPTYYFRGNVNNNYVSFAGETWRIIRFNEDGSIKIITEVKPSSLSTVGYNTNSSYTDSTISDLVNTWYSNTITSAYQSKVSNSMFCNDYTDSVLGRITTNSTPTFNCNNEANNIFSNVATLTADEVIYAGGLVNSVVTNNSYLTNNEQFFTLTGINYTDIYTFGVDNPLLNPYASTNTYGIRPVINLKSNVIVSSGEGTSTSPYVIN